MFRIIARAQHTWLRLPWIELFLVGLFAIQVPFSCSSIELDTLGSPLGKLNRISNFCDDRGQLSTHGDFSAPLADAQSRDIHCRALLFKADSENACYGVQNLKSVARLPCLIYLSQVREIGFKCWMTPPTC
ncbi:hypothetical protein BJX68DRAFT_223499 [Aspergillus pseudodeflectus]|uniref:Cyanovirin-N domain-containing protein n=1 Tax=Aspergillus pseudodeflectus TaxID=176178 RepID=A0ABR4LBK5_9EURO